MKPPFAGARAARGWLLLAVVAVTGWFFGPMLLGGGFPAAGDAASFYLPLFRYVDDQWHSGRVPLWNPYDNLGMPLAATGTASVFYPGRLLFLLPVSYPRAYVAYLVAHWLLAAWGAAHLARCWRAGRGAAALAAATYALGAPVLALYSNVVFLVGAAWLPWGVAAIQRTLRTGRWRAAAALAVVLALVTLGGDPQAAFHLGLIAVVQATWIALCAARSAGSAAAALGGPVARRLLLLPASAGLAACLAAVQVVPSLELARRSDRSLSWAARSLAEVPAALRHDDAAARIAAGLLGPGDPGTYHARVFDYSVPPWRWAEFLWPNVGGRSYPVHRHWFAAWSDDTRLWTPSLYLGLLPLLLAATALRWRGGPPLDRGLSWLVTLALLAGLGQYGLGWLLQQLPGPAVLHDVGRQVAPPVGGLYWLMTVTLPGYIQFRYPAKLMTLAALGLAILAARGWDQAQAGRAPHLRRWLALVSLLSGLGVALSLAIRPWWSEWTSSLAPHPLFGPFDAPGAANDLVRAFAHTALVGAAAWLLPWRPACRVGLRNASVALLLLADLALAGRWIVADMPVTTVCGRPALADVLSATALPESRWPRIHRRWDWTGAGWDATSSADRWTAIIDWERSTLAPNHHLDARLGNLEVYGTLMLADYQAWLAAIQRRGVNPLADVALSPRGEAVEQATPAAPPGPAVPLPDDLTLWRPVRRLPRVWIAHDVRWLPPIDHRDIDAIAARTAEVWDDHRTLDELRSRPAVESARPPDEPPPLRDEAQGAGGARPAEAPGTESCRIVRDDPDVVVLEAELRRPGLVVLADQYYPGWELEVRTAGQGTAVSPILRTNRLLRGCWLPAGSHTLSFRYRPASVAFGALASAAAWLALAAAWALGGRRRRSAGVPGGPTSK